jgi:alpha-beta hydrolase superfamily lysophospholipase
MKPALLLGIVLGPMMPVAVPAATIPAPVTLRAEDGLKVSGLYYRATRARAIILLFHQAGSSKGEYATIAPRLVAAGFSALAIDQRSGGSLFGPNETSRRLGREATYREAKMDLAGALAWARSTRLPVILWGSSYSAALVFEVAAEHPGETSAVLAFSPGEYLGSGRPVARAAARVSVPIYVTSSAKHDEIEAARQILAASPSTNKVQYAPAIGVHGASTLIAARDPRGATDNWRHVLAFLSGLKLAGH